MTSIDGIKKVLSLGQVRYIVVRPHRGMKDGYEVINAWNQDMIREFGPDEREEAIAYARKECAWRNTFDQVLVALPEAEPEEVSA